MDFIVYEEKILFFLDILTEISFKGENWKLLIRSEI